LLVGPTNELAVVLDTYAPVQGLVDHKIRVDKGSFKVGDVISADVDVEKTRCDATQSHRDALDACRAA
jgi:alanyl-tRNA synthetase